MSRAAFLVCFLICSSSVPNAHAEDDDDDEDESAIAADAETPIAEPAATPIAEPAATPTAAPAKSATATPTAAPAKSAAAMPVVAPAKSAVAMKALAGDGSEARPPLPAIAPDAMPLAPPGLDVGVGLAWVSRPISNGLVTTDASYAAAPGFAVRLDWPIVSWLRFHPYFVWARHDVSVAPGALTTASATSIAADAVVAPLTATTFAFGARVAPTFEFSPRWRAWIAAGVGYGRIGISHADIVDSDGGTYTLRSRDGVFVEAPLAAGVAFELIPRWLAVFAETSGAPVFGQSGAAHESVQAVDADGALREVGPLGAFEASFVQSIGLSLIL
ncbi:MAG: hypothetical protein EXR75_04425 [Myxococcales bacterium]|nr:hypothetical protein [Myxococcales bacterium]